ncbi:MAG: type VI secretion system baseplate subunit TssK [Cellvibrionaceae bacterium]|nr:type VI secretion system baseplate subunit TssK [Cellvibrionaceae bacterium]
MPASIVTPITQRVQSSAANCEVIDRQLPKAVCWHEGMLLSPHHFQQNHQYWEGQLSRIISVLSPNYWGVGELQVAFLGSEIHIKRLRAILPDGLLVDYDNRAGREQQLIIDINAVDDENASASIKTVQLTVPIQVAGSASEHSEIQRYSSYDDNCTDENTNDNKIVMPRLLPKLALQIGDRVSSAYIGLPLFRVMQVEGGSLQLASDYCPPLLSIGADSFRAGTAEIPGPKSIQQRAQDLAKLIRYKATKFAGAAEANNRFGRHHRWIRAMVHKLTELELLSDSPQSLPCDLYQCLVCMAGSISELSPKNIPDRFLAYYHDDFLPDFDKVINYITTQVERVNLNYTTLAFDAIEEGKFSITLDKSWYQNDLIIELKASSEQTRDNLDSWLQSCRIASEGLHSALAKRRLLGAKTLMIEKDQDSGITPALGNGLYKIRFNKKVMRPQTKLLIAAASTKVKHHCPKEIVIHIPDNATVDTASEENENA